MSTERKLFWGALYLALLIGGAVYVLRAINVVVLIHTTLPAFSEDTILRALPSAPRASGQQNLFTPSAQHPEKKKTLVRLVERAPWSPLGVNSFSGRFRTGGGRVLHLRARSDAGVDSAQSCRPEILAA